MRIWWIYLGYSSLLFRAEHDDVVPIRAIHPPTAGRPRLLAALLLCQDGSSVGL